MIDRAANKILIACPMSREADVLESLLGGQPGIEVTATGIGIKRSVPFLLRRLRTDPPRLLIFTGSVSQLNPALLYRQVITPGSWMLEREGPTFDCTFPAPESSEHSLPRALSMSHPVMRPALREELFAETGAHVYDSVTAAVVRIAGTSGVPCITPKIVANTVDSGLLAFWSRLDKNLAPLADYLVELLEIIHHEEE